MRVREKHGGPIKRVNDVRGVVITPEKNTNFGGVEGATNWETQVMSGNYAPRIWVDLDADVMANTRETICTATVKFPDGKSAVVHFDVHVNDNGKVEARVTAGARTRDIVRAVNVPAWNRRHA